ncbi:unnamed protein product, partial [Rotaria socialis]
MQTIDNIVFDDVIFPRANLLAALLYQMDGVPIAVPLPHAHLMSFIEVFRNTNTCQNHIIANNQKEIKLFVHQNNMQWLFENSFVDTVPQLAKINIFCSSPGSKAFWSTYTQRYRRIIEQPILYNELNFQLLLFGFLFEIENRNQFKIPNRTSKFENAITMKKQLQNRTSQFENAIEVQNSESQSQVNISKKMLSRQLLILFLFVLFTANLAQKYVPNGRNDNEDAVQPVNRAQLPSNNDLKPASSINANVPPASDRLAPRRYIDSNRRPSSSLPTPLAASKECESDV